jgi:alcohol dehydrogenase class IV
MVDAFCRAGIPLAASALRNAYRDGSDKAARESMSLASLLGGLALANGKLGAVHGMANPIGGMSHAPHGAICARLLPLVMETNIHSLREKEPDSPALGRYTEVARLITGNATSEAEAGAAWVRELCLALDIRPLKEFGLDRDDFPRLAEQSQKANSMKGNAIPLEDDEILQLLEEAY